MTALDVSGRIDSANALVLEISSRGRRFFHSARFCRVGAFEMTAKCKLRWRDEYTDKLVDTTSDRMWPYFSHGGTLRRLLEDLTAYIVDGTKLHHGHFGPWGEAFRGDLWGYGFEAMESLRNAIRTSDCVDWSEAENGNGQEAA